MTPRRLYAFLLLFVLAAPAAAQLPQAQLDRLFPLGGACGTQVIVKVEGKDLDDLTSLHLDRTDIKVEKLKPDQFRLTIPAGATAGTVEVRTVGRFGISGSRLFAVTKGLAEVAEKEPNDTPATAQPVSLDCAINGTSDADGDDYFSFEAKKGQRVVLDCQAQRLDSTLRAVLVVSTAAGKEIAHSKPYFDRTDPLLDLRIPADGLYTVGLHDATYAGGLPYRLIVTTRPHVENVFPLAVEPGKKTTLSVLGRNLPGSTPWAGGRVQDRRLDLLSVPFTAPKDLKRGFEFLVHPSAPAAEADALQVVPDALSRSLTPLTLLRADAPVILEREPNDTAATAQAITWPSVVCGRLDKPGDADWYQFTAKAGDEIAVDLFCERLGLPGDPFVLVTDAKGNELAQFDDHGISFNALALYNRDPHGTFRAPAAGTYRLLVQDRYRQGGPRFAYALKLTHPAPDLYPVAFHETNPDPTCPLVRRGGSAFLEVCLNRRHFSGPVVIEAHGLPAGVRCPAVHVSPQSDTATVVFTADANASDWSGAIRLETVATVNGKEMSWPVRAVQRRWAIANVSTCRLCRQICLAVRPGAAYGLTLPALASTSQGGTVELKVGLKRQGDFQGKVGLTGLGLPPGFGIAATEVPADKTEGTAKLTVAANVPPGSYSIVVRGDAQVPFRHDPKEKMARNVRVADPSTPVVVEVRAKKGTTRRVTP
jgi:hypothetical protein